MGIFAKIKDMFIEETDDDEPVQINDNRIAQKIELPKKVEETPRLEPAHNIEEVIKEEATEKTRTPVIFDDEDFVEDFVKEEETKEHVLYGGAPAKEIVKEKKVFTPTPVISPVYGVLSKNYQPEDHDTKKDLDHLFVDERKKKITFDSVRQKAYGDLTEELQITQIREVPHEERSLLYDLESEEKEPVVQEVTMGDAEEYFQDLGLEYNVDYIDTTKSKKSRVEKNKDLSDEIDKTSPKSAIPKEEKNLYDLIDMMYENKEE